MRKILLVVAVIGALFLASQASAQNYTYNTSVDSQSMQAVLDHFCSSTNPVANCGVYQYEITQASIRAGQLTTMMRSYSASERRLVTEALLQRISRAFYNAPDTNTKVVSAFYYNYFSGQLTSQSPDELFTLLFDNGNTPRQTFRPVSTSPYNNYGFNTNSSYNSYATTTTIRSGSIQNVWSNNKYTTISSSRKRIIMENNVRDMELVVRTTGSRDVTVTASVPGRSSTYKGKYTNNGTWEFDFGSRLNSERSVTFTLLSGRTVLDRVTYTIDVDRYYGSQYNNYYRYNDDYRYDNEGDLGITQLGYDYDTRSSDTIIELTTTIINYDSYDELIVDRLEYDVEVNNRRVREGSDFDYRHIRTRCDDSSSYRYDDEDITIESREQCEVIVELRFDQNLENDSVEIMVELESRDDDRTSNNYKTISFSVR